MIFYPLAHVLAEFRFWALLGSRRSDQGLGSAYGDYGETYSTQPDGDGLGDSTSPYGAVYSPHNPNCYCGIGYGREDVP